MTTGRINQIATPIGRVRREGKLRVANQGIRQPGASSAGLPSRDGTASRTRFALKELLGSSYNRSRNRTSLEVGSRQDSQVSTFCTKRPTRILGTVLQSGCLQETRASLSRAAAFSSLSIALSHIISERYILLR